MDADVKGRLRLLLVAGQGGGCWGLATGAMATTTVTLRCAGRDRRTVSGRELPRTKVASRDRIDGSRVLRRFAPVTRPQPSVGLDGEELLSGGLLGHLGPEEASEFTGDSDGHDGGALALLGEMAMAVKETDLRVPGPVAGLGTSGGASGCVAVVPGSFGQQAAGVAVAALGDMPAMLLIAGGVLAGSDPQPGRELTRVREAREVADLGDQPQRGQRRDPAKRTQLCDLPLPTVLLGDMFKLGVESGELAVETVEVFCGWFGSVLGDLALLYGAQGGIYLAGGVLPQIKDLLLRSAFVERFLDKGAMREALTRTPVRLIDHAQLGVIGAASWYLSRDSNKPRVTRADAHTRDGAAPTMDLHEPASVAQRPQPPTRRGEKS